MQPGWTGGIEALVGEANRWLGQLLPADRAARPKDEVNPRLVRHYTTQGLLPAPRREGRDARYDRLHLMALLALRRKKYQEQLLAKTDAQLAQLEQLTRSVEFAAIQKDVLFGLQQGTRVLREIHAEMGGLDHVEKLMGDTADAIAYQQVSARGRMRRL